MKNKLENFKIITKETDEKYVILYYQAGLNTTNRPFVRR